MLREVSIAWIVLDIFFNLELSMPTLRLCIPDKHTKSMFPGMHRMYVLLFDSYAKLNNPDTE